MREIEVKAVVDDWSVRRRLVERAGGTLTFAGRMADRRYDTPARDIGRRDEVLRLRTYHDAAGERAELDWKGRTGQDGAYKMREEIQVPCGDARAAAAVLERLGYIVTHVIDREIAQYTLDGATVRFERYPRMDDLVEVEGPPHEIERAIAALGIAREAFTAERLPAFVLRWQARTGRVAALSDDELSGRARYAVEDA